MHRNVLLPLLLWACPSTDPSESELDAPTDTGSATSTPSWLDISADLKSVKGNRAPGLVGAVARADELVALGAAGRRKRGGGGDVLPDDVFHIGSVTKVYTALLVARLVDAGETSWALTLGEVFPDAHPDWSEITLEMLLRHESGATGSLGDDFPTLWAQMFEDGDADVMQTRAQLADTVLAEPPTHPPGSVVYSNAGLTLVGAALEAQRGVAWEEDLTTWVLEPLGQTDCGFGPPLGDQPWGHDYFTGDPVDPTDPYADNPPALGPAGTLACPVASLAGLGRAYLQADGGDTSFLSAESYAMLTAPNSVDLVPGMVVSDDQPWAGGRAYAMTGSNSYWYATIWIAPALDRTFAVIANSGTPESADAVNDAILLMIDEEL